MKRIFNLSLWRAGATAALALASLLGGTAASAAPSLNTTQNGFTPANTTIGNKATLTYSVGGQAQNAIGSSDTGNTTGPGSPTNFVVDNYVRHTLTAQDSAVITGLPGQLVTATFVVSNTGNGTQDYKITVTNLTGSQTAYGNTYTTAFSAYSASCTIVADAAVRDYVPSLRPDYSAVVNVACTMPATQPNGDVAVFSVVAEARDAGSGGGAGGTLTQTNNGINALDVVFADRAGPDDVDYDAKYSAHGAFKVSNATLQVQKVVAAVCDDLHGITNANTIPGAYVKYTVSITNTGSTTASLTQVQDVLNTNVDYDANLINPTNAADCVATGPVWSAGNNFKVDVAGTTRTGFPKYFKADAADTNLDGARLDLAAGVQTITVDLAKLLAAQAAPTVYTAGELKPNESVQLIYQVRIK